MTVNKDRVELFLAALESGKYTQCTGHLRKNVLPVTGAPPDTQHHCVLGVATEVALDNGLREEMCALGYHGDEFLFDGGRLNGLVMQWYGFDSVDPTLKEDEFGWPTPVSTLNDGGSDFWTLAQAGRAQWLKDQG